MTIDENLCGYYGMVSAQEEKPFDPGQDERMNCMVYPAGRELTNARNLSAWRLGYLAQYAEYGNPISREMFQTALRGMLPTTKAGAEMIWADFARDCVKQKEYVDSVEEPDEIALSRWYDTFLASFVLLKRNFGEDVATFICDLSLDNQCLYPCEMERAGQDVKDGGNVDSLFELMEDGLLEAPEFVFPKLRDTAPEMMPGMVSQL